ncbi:MAG: hypothetical protein MHM6MM_002996 [Cercozoa sp. M6MM]
MGNVLAHIELPPDVQFLTESAPPGKQELEEVWNRFEQQQTLRGFSSTLDIVESSWDCHFDPKRLQQLRELLKKRWKLECQRSCVNVLDIFALAIALSRSSFTSKVALLFRAFDVAQERQLCKSSMERAAVAVACSLVRLHTSHKGRQLRSKHMAELIDRVTQAAKLFTEHCFREADVVRDFRLDLSEVVLLQF